MGALLCTSDATIHLRDVRGTVHLGIMVTCSTDPASVISRQQKPGHAEVLAPVIQERHSMQSGWWFC